MINYIKILFITIVFISIMFIPIIFICTNAIFIIAYTIFVVPLIDIIYDWYVNKYIL